MLPTNKLEYGLGGVDAVDDLLRALLLVGVASSVPWAAGRVCGNRWSWPLDFGVKLRDGERLFGDHKTWRGLITGIAVCSLAGSLLDVGYLVGAAAGFLGLAGDAASSAIKRRLRRPPGAEVPGLDQIPEALLPLLILREPLGLSFSSVVAVTLVFAVLDLVVAPLRNPHSKRLQP
jgi:CDP-2,3-bis-(O-geranylgeranyl)-sn-glycerol synthase